MSDSPPQANLRNTVRPRRWGVEGADTEPQPQLPPFKIPEEASQVLVSGLSLGIESAFVVVGWVE